MVVMMVVVMMMVMRIAQNSFPFTFPPFSLFLFP